MNNRLTLVFSICFFLLFSTSCDETNLNDLGDGNEEEPVGVVPSDSDKNFSLFYFPKNNNLLEDDIVGVIDDANKTITLRTNKWISNIEALVPIFESEGKVMVEGVEQISKYTSLSFANRSVVYKIEANDNTSVDYVVTLISPQTTGLPVIKIDVEGGLEITDKTEAYYKANILIRDYKNPEFNLDSSTGIRGRGNTTWKYSKKPYRIKFDSKTSLFGLGAEKSWVLLANYLDPSLLMTSVAFEMGHRTELSYTNHEFACEFFMNGVYRGHYTLTEQVQVNKNRVNVDKNKGFLIEIDHYYDDTPKFRTDILNLPVMIKSPKAEFMGEVSWVQDYIQEFENELMKDFSTSKYKDYVDVNSVINYMIVNEITCNGDLYPPKSLYIHKDKDSKMYFGPIWDFDWAFGKNTSAGTFVFFGRPNNTLFTPNPNSEQSGRRFFTRFLQDPEFHALYKARWNELKMQGKLDFNEFIDEKARALDYSQQLNFALWNNGLNFYEQINKMKSWMIDHTVHVDKDINNDFQ